MDRELSLTLSLLEGAIEIAEDRLAEREKVNNSEWQRIVAAVKRFAKLVDENKGKV